METKDWLSLIAILATLVVAALNLAYSLANTRRTAYVNTVTASRMRWIDSLRDKVSKFIGLTYYWSVTALEDAESNRVIQECDVLRIQITLHLNPNDDVDKRIAALVDRIPSLTSRHKVEQLQEALNELRIATQDYLKKEWDRVKRESVTGRS